MGPWQPAARQVMTPLLLSAATAALLGVPTPASASPYRLVFVTGDVFEATSTSIADYNADVTAEAALNTSLPATTWYAIGSTATVSAYTNITSCAGCDGDVPIYLVGGSQIATSLSDLFSNSGNPPIYQDQFGDYDFGDFVWTGTNADGSAATGDELGSSAPVYGYDSSASAEFEFNANSPNTDADALYAISAVINTPEPASGALLAAR
jgi:hypothetical protein